MGDDERSGRPSTAVYDENVSKVSVVLLEKPHLTLRIILKKLNISKDAVRTILTKKLTVEKYVLILFHIS